ncbi:MAG: POTRA domain-containing protein, partial [Candidatus Sericytochromatia bacterium]
MEKKPDTGLNAPDISLENIEKIKVTDIVINGTERKESALIAMFIKKGDSVTPNQIREDLQRIFGLGYFADVQATKESFLDGFRIVVNVIENPVLKDVEVFGNTIVKTETFHDVFNNQVGKIINLNDVKESIELLRKAYTEKGYEAVSISPQLLADGRIFFNINEGVIEEIKLTNTGETKPEIVMREIRQKAGDIFNIATMREDLRRVYNTNFFENVDIKPGPGKKNPNHIIIEIVVKEKQTGSINLGAGYNTRDGIVGTFSISKDNVFGTGQRLLVDLQAGAGWLSVTGANWLGRVDWYEPWFLPQYLPPRTGLGFSLYRQRQGNFFQDVNPFSFKVNDLTAESRYILISDRTGVSVNLGAAILGDPLTTPWRISSSIRAEMISPALPRVEDVLITKPIENNQTKTLTIIDLEKSTDAKD